LDSIASAIKSEYTVLAPFRASLESVTQQFSMYTIVRNDKQEAQMVLGDVYGWSETNYKKDELGYLLDGHIKSGYTETVNGFMPQKGNPHYRQDSTYNDKIHSVIVVVSAATVGSTAEMRKLNEFYKSLTDRGYQPIFVLTKVDRLPDEVLIGKNENILDSGIVEATIQNFSEMSHIPRASVLPIINYQGPYTQGADYVIEMLALIALNAALQNAKNFLEKFEETIVEDAKESKGRKKSSGKKIAKKDESEEEESEEEDESGEEDDEDETEPVSDDDKKSKKSKSKKKEAEKKKKTLVKSPRSSPAKQTPVKSPRSSPAKQTPEKEQLSPKPSPPVSPSGVMGLVEATAYLSVEESELLELLESKKIPGKMIGSSWKITKEAIDNYLNS